MEHSPEAALVGALAGWADTAVQWEQQTGRLSGAVGAALQQAQT